MTYSEIEGNLIELTKAGTFDVITHGCNCFCTMGAGIAVEMHKHFRCNDETLFKLEDRVKHMGNVNKLGCIEDRTIRVNPGSANVMGLANNPPRFKYVTVVNSYTQYHYGRKGYLFGRYRIPLDYEALALCMMKINHKFIGKSIGLPPIGCTHGGGDWERVKKILQVELRDMSSVTVVKYKP